MPPLTCAFADKIRLIDEISAQNERGIFVPTEKDFRTGSEVALEIRFGTADTTLSARAKVVAKRPKGSSRQRAGVWVQFSPAQAELLRQTLQIDEGEGAYVTARAGPRFDCNLPVLVDKPVRQPFRSRNISQEGICLGDVLAVPVGQTIRLTIEFAELSVVVYGKVAWRRDENALTGVEFRFQNDQVRQTVAEEVRRIDLERDIVVRAKPTVLIVDDDLATLKALERAFTARGYGTATAASGPEALTVARQRTPAMILLDVLLPGMNGIEVCRVLKRDIGVSGIPVVLTSVLPRDNLAMLLAEAGALVALPKPYRFERVIALVERILSNTRPLRAPAEAGPIEERRATQRIPVFQRCYYESTTLRLETYVRDASEAGLFIASVWGDPPGTRGRLTLMMCPEHPVDIVMEVEIVHRTDWGILQDFGAEVLPGLGLKLHPGAKRREFVEWLAEHGAALANKPVIMVVDDDRSQLDLLGIVLRNAGLGVITLDTPGAVLNAVTRAAPALIILDYMMPGVDGVTLCKMLKGNPTTWEVPVWLHSSVSEEHLQQLVEESGADGFIRKGARPGEITDRIKNFLA